MPYKYKRRIRVLRATTFAEPRVQFSSIHSGDAVNIRYSTRFAGTELKFRSTHLATFGDIDTQDLTVASGNGYFLFLSGCTQGTPVNRRIGNEIRLKKLYIRGRISSNEVVNDTVTNCLAVCSAMYRLVVFCDKQTNGVAPLTVDLFASGHFDAPFNENFHQKFKILKDVRFTHNRTLVKHTSSAYHVPKMATTFYYEIPLNLGVTFKGTGSSVDDVATNSIWCIIYSLNTGQRGSASLTSRIYYCDL